MTLQITTLAFAFIGALGYIDKEISTKGRVVFAIVSIIGILGFIYVRLNLETVVIK